ncbi:MAG: hypothetical protein WBM44_07075 [Waterburya sp.]
MATTKTIAKKQHKQVKRKDRFNHHLDLETPQVPLSKQKHQPRHELLSDWKDAS